MQIKKVSNDKMCSFCKNCAKYKLSFRKLGVLFNLYFCFDCLKSMYVEIGKCFVPKSLNEPFGKKEC